MEILFTLFSFLKDSAEIFDFLQGKLKDYSWVAVVGMAGFGVKFLKDYLNERNERTPGMLTVQETLLDDDGLLVLYNPKVLEINRIFPNQVTRLKFEQALNRTNKDNPIAMFKNKRDAERVYMTLSMGVVASMPNLAAINESPEKLGPINEFIIVATKEHDGDSTMPRLLVFYKDWLDSLSPEETSRPPFRVKNPDHQTRVSTLNKILRMYHKDKSQFGYYYVRCPDKHLSQQMLQSIAAE